MALKQDRVLREVTGMEKNMLNVPCEKRLTRPDNLPLKMAKNVLIRYEYLNICCDIKIANRKPI